MPKREAERIEKVMPIFVTKVDAEQGIVDAIVNTYGIIDHGEDMLVNGVFAKSIIERGRKIPVLNSHSTWSIHDILGKCLALRELNRDELPAETLLQFPDATGALWTSTQYDIDTPEGSGAFKRIKSGSLNEYSIGFQCLQWEYRTIGDRSVRIIREGKLWEYSPVVFGMNQATGTTGIKSGIHPVIFDMGRLAEDIKAGRVLNSENATRLKTAVKELISVLDSAGIPLDTEDSMDSDDQDDSKAQAGPLDPDPAPTPIRDSETEAKRQKLLEKLNPST